MKRPGQLRKSPLRPSLQALSGSASGQLEAHAVKLVLTGAVGLQLQAATHHV